MASDWPCPACAQRERPDFNDHQTRIMNTAVNHRLYFISTRTPTHVGCGQGLGDIDLPIIRNAWGLPILPGSSVKGVLRQHAPAAWGLTDADVKRLFGPEREQASEHAGILAPQDANLLAMPVASFRGGWAWVTSTALLRRLCRDAVACGWGSKLPAVPSAPEDSQVLVSSEGIGQLAVDVGGSALMMLGESALAGHVDAAVSAWGRELAERAYPQDDSAWQTDFARRLVVVSDGLFAHFMRVATEVRARVSVDEDRVANDRALWREECVPADSLFWGVISALHVQSANKDAALDPTDALSRVAPACVQIGGKASVGYGWVDFLPQTAGAGAAS